MATEPPPPLEKERPTPNYNKWSVLILCIVAGLGSFNFGYNVCVVNTSIYVMLQTLEWCGDNVTIECEAATSGKALAMTILFVGGVIGSVSCSQLLPFGRRRTLLISSVFFMVSSVLCALAPTGKEGILLGRFLSGIGIGIASVGSPTYLNEAVPNKWRGSFGTIHQIMISIGCFSGVLIGLPLTIPSLSNPSPPDNFNQFWWRFMFLISSFIALLQFLAYIFVYKEETVPYLLQFFPPSLKRQQAINTFESYISSPSHTLPPDFSIHSSRSHPLHLPDNSSPPSTREILSIDDSQNTFQDYTLMREKESLPPPPPAPPAVDMPLSHILADKESRHALLIACILGASQQLVGINIIMTNSNTLFQKNLVPEDQLSRWSTVVTLSQIVANFVSFILLRHFGRKTLLLLSLIGETVCLLPSLYTFFSDTVSSVSVLFSVIGFAFFFSIGMGPVLWLYLNEIFIPKNKSVGISLASMFNWLTTIFAVSLFYYFTLKTLFFGMFVVGFLLVFFFFGALRETKHFSQGTSPYFASFT